MVHVDGKIDPLSDIETINTELILSDMEVLDRSDPEARQRTSKGDKSLQKELDLLQPYRRMSCAEGKSARTLTELDRRRGSLIVKSTGAAFIQAGHIRG